LSELWDRARSRSSSIVVSWERWSRNQRAASTPISASSSSSVTNVPARLDIEAAAGERDELHDEQLEAVGPPAERLERGVHAVDVAVVVGAPHVDEQVEAALALVLVVGDVRREVRVVARGALDDAVLVVAELGRAQPERALVR
jgi:NAD/NADP transhydrogenase alpha subunit